MAGADKSAQPRKKARELFDLALGAQRKGNLDDAIRLYNESIEAHPSAEAYTYLGWSHSFRKDYDRAIAYCRRAIDLDPAYGNPYNDIGAYLIERGDWDEAIEWLRAATRARRYRAYHYPHFNLGRIYQHRFDFELAEYHYRMALRFFPRYKRARRALALIQARKN